MTTWTVLYSTGDDENAKLHEIVVEADYKREARKIGVELCPSGYSLSDIAKKRGGHGGKRQGSGQPAKHGEKTKPVRLPESLVNTPEGMDRIIAIPELQRLLSDWEQDCEDNPNSVRRHFLRQALAEIRSLGY